MTDDVPHPPIVYVEWIDAAQVASGWLPLEEALDNAEHSIEPIAAAGFLIKRARRYLIVAAGHNPHNGEVMQSYLIPRRNITRLIYLREAAK